MQTIRAHLLRNAAADGKYTNRYRKQRVSKNSLSGVQWKLPSLACLQLSLHISFTWPVTFPILPAVTPHLVSWGTFQTHSTQSNAQILDHIPLEFWIRVTNKSTKVCNEMAIISFGKRTRSPYRLSERRFKLRSKWPIFTKLGTNGLPLAAANPTPHTLISRTD